MSYYLHSACLKIGLLGLLSLLVGCDSHRTSPREINAYLDRYQATGNNVIRTARQGKLEALVNLEDDKKFIDRIPYAKRADFYQRLSRKIVMVTLAEQGNNSNKPRQAQIDLVTVSARDEYGKPDFSSLKKLATVQCKIGQDVVCLS